MAEYVDMITDVIVFLTGAIALGVLIWLASSECKRYLEKNRAMEAIIDTQENSELEIAFQRHLAQQKERLRKFRESVILKAQGRIDQTEDGLFVHYVDGECGNGGCLTAPELRIIADNLDERTKRYDSQRDTLN